MNISIGSLDKDFYKDLDLIFIDEARNKETEIRFAPYLKEYFDFNEDDLPVAEEDGNNLDAEGNY